jgi:hypothetical protein
MTRLPDNNSNDRSPFAKRWEIWWLAGLGVRPSPAYFDEPIRSSELSKPPFFPSLQMPGEQSLAFASSYAATVR